MPPHINDDERLWPLGAVTDATLSDHAAALALQRSLLPARLPEVPGVELAARYVPGHAFGVGGDWFDVFTLPSGWLGVVIGDVSGHGLASAVVMGRIRSALRAYALICDDPAEALTLLNRKVHVFEAGSLTTALYAMVNPARDLVTVSSAGHLPPVLAEPGRPAALAPVPVDPPLGLARPGAPRRTTALALRPGAVLLCYTDGLVERRQEVIDDGLDRLVHTVRAKTVQTTTAQTSTMKTGTAQAGTVQAETARASTAEEVCATVMADVPVESPTDDVAVLAVRRPG